MADLTSDSGVADPDRPVRVSPSRVESFLECELRTLMQELGVRDEQAVAASLGTVIHALAAVAPDDQSLEEFEKQLDAVWGSLEFGASWFAANERRRAASMLQRLCTWLRDSRAEFTRVGVELPFEVEIGDAVVRGQVDRLERDGAGRLVVVDLKTGKKATDLPGHPQLGTYQLAVEHGAFADIGTVAGGAQLVQLGAAGEITQSQAPLAEVEDPNWVRAAIDHVAERMRGHEFTAMLNKRCHVCDVKTSCPLQITGRQVTQ